MNKNIFVLIKKCIFLFNYKYFKNVNNHINNNIISN